MGVIFLVGVVQLIGQTYIGEIQNVELYGQLSLRLAYLAFLTSSLVIIISCLVKRRDQDARALFKVCILFVVFAGMFNIDIIIVGKKFDLEQLGYYNSWVQFAKIIVLSLLPIAALIYLFFVKNTKRFYRQLVFILSLVVLVVIGITTNLGYGAYGKKLIFTLLSESFYPINTYLEWAAYYGTGYIMLMVMSFYFLTQKNLISFVPVLLFPIYFVALLVYPNTIADVMFINIAYIFSSITILLMAFFKDRVIFMFKE